MGKSTSASGMCKHNWSRGHDGFRYELCHYSATAWEGHCRGAPLRGTGLAGGCKHVREGVLMHAQGTREETAFTKRSMYVTLVSAWLNSFTLRCSSCTTCLISCPGVGAGVGPLPTGSNTVGTAVGEAVGEAVAVVGAAVAVGAAVGGVVGVDTAVA